MNIAIIKDGKCVNIALFDSLETAQSFLTVGAFYADAVVALPDGYGIGDSYDGETWTKAPEPEPDESESEESEPSTEATLEERVAAIETAIEKGLTL